MVRPAIPRGERRRHYHMKRLLLATALAMTPIAAMADVTLLDKLSGTGDNVVFDSQSGGLILGSFNGQNQGVVDFTDLSGNPLFVGAANGNDIKIANTSDLQVQVFDATNTSVLATTTDVFSLKGTGNVTAFVTANEQGGGTMLFTFNLGAIDPNAQSGLRWRPSTARRSISTCYSIPGAVLPISSTIVLTLPPARCRNRPHGR